MINIHHVPLALIYLHVYTDTIVISLTLICIHVAPVIPPSRLSENDVLFPPRSHSSVKQPSLCWNYDSPSGMRRPVPRWQQREMRNEKGRSPGTRLPGRPTLFRKHLPLHLRLCSPRSGHKVLSYSHQTVWLEAAADVTVLVFGFVSPLSTLLFSPPLDLVSAGCQRLVCAFLRSWKKRGLWKRSWDLGFCNLWTTGFFFFSPKLPLTQQPKVQSKQTEANGFIFSSARQFAHNRDASFCPFYNQF